MSLRLYRALRIGNGAKADPYRAALTRYPSAQFDMWNNTARTGFAACGFYCLASAESAVHAQIAADADIQAMSPEQDTPVALSNWLDGQIGSGVSASLRTAIESDGVPIDDVTATTTRRALLRRISIWHRLVQLVRGQRDADALAFFREALDGLVFQVPAAARNRIQAWMQNRGMDTSWITGTTPVRDVVKYIVANGGLAPLPLRAGMQALEF